jgi:hypothetical protein
MQFANIPEKFQKKEKEKRGSSLFQVANLKLSRNKVK